MTPEQLRASILQYAMEGKLVKQDPNDEPASVLLEKIKAEKEVYFQKNNIAKERKLPVITEDEKQFNLPNGWQYTRVQDISLFITDYVANGSFKTLKEHTKKSKTKDYAIFVRTMDLSANFKNNLSYIDKDSYDFLSKSKLFGGELILPNIGGSIGKVFLMPNLGTHMSLAPNSVMLKFTYSILNKYFKYFIQSPYGQASLLNKKGGSATPKFSKTQLRKIVLMLPPLEEQKRIVAKIEKLMPLIDQYAKAYNRLKEIDDNFNDKMKQSILQYAMEGKLVKQDPTDEPASVLLEKIKAEKAELVKEKKIKKSKPLPPITDDEKPFDIPDSWEWIRLYNLSAPVEYPFADGPFGSNLKKEHYTDKKEVRIIQLSNIGEGGWKDKNHKYTTFSHLKEIERSEVKAGDIVIAKMMPAGRAIAVPKNLEKKFVLSSDAVKFVPNKYLNEEYLLYAINSLVFKNQVLEEVTGITRKRTSLTKLKQYILPIPPIEEQKRIVNKIEQLKLMNLNA